MKSTVFLCLCSAFLAAGVTVCFLQNISGATTANGQVQERIPIVRTGQSNFQPSNNQPAVIPERKFSPEEKTNIAVYENVNPSVVNIDTKAHQRDEFWFLGGEGRTKEGSGSGWVLDKQGHIVTNYHVIEGSDLISVTLSNFDEPFPAEVIGTDPQNDIAVLQIDAPKQL